MSSTAIKLIHTATKLYMQKNLRSALAIAGTFLSILALITTIWIARYHLSKSADGIYDVLPLIAVSLTTVMAPILFVRLLRDYFFFRDTVDAVEVDPESLMKALDSRFKDLERAATLLDDNDREALSKEIAERVRSELVSESLKRQLDAIEERQKKQAAQNAFNALAGNATKRITQQIAALGGRANLNLMIGLCLALTGIVFLLFYVQTVVTAQGADFMAFLIQFLPRISVVTIVELFSYFFLRLYKQAIDEIKYFQNEITNIELKLLAANMASQSWPTDPTQIMSSLVATERNFLIPKDQRIVADPQEVSVQTASQRILDTMRDIVGRKSS